MPFNHVEDVIADIAFIFHWSPADLWAISLPELLDWRQRATERFRMAYATKT
ncbi:phage tail protein, P2 GpE family [Escherichia coli M056]|uniref:GpE family phage tail protein n=1 Tax=Escherichia coli TaxID=562 RepID=UPI000A187855|nr:phage tail protein, P2 GpE family [Escherichia coli M056]